MRYLPADLFVANTDQQWFDYLSTRASGGVVDEVNFWQPKGQRTMRRMVPGDPVVFRLKKPKYALAGFGFYAHFELLDLETAWSTFGWKNGDPDKLRFFDRIGKYRAVDLLDPKAPRERLGCTILREARFYSPDRWLPWRATEGWSRYYQVGVTIRSPDSIAQIHGWMEAELVRRPEEFAGGFVPLDVDDRELRVRDVVARDGQGAFRLRLLDAYDRQCAITGEHTVPVLDAAHIQPYLGARSNHVQNGIVLTKELHTLFDRGYVGITPDYVVRVAGRLRDDYGNGKRYYPFDGQKLVYVPTDARERPSREALEWHHRHVFLGAG